MVISMRKPALYLLSCLACIAVVAYLPGCSPVTLPDGEPADAETTQRGKGLIEMTAPAENLTVVLGDTVELGWSIEGNQSGTIELFYQDQGGQQTLFQTLPVEAQGAVDFDSSVLNFGQTYRFGATLKPDQGQQSADYADGTVRVGNPALTAVTPSKDIERGLREAFTVEWDGQYLPKGGQCRVVVDFDRRLGSGDELLLGTKDIPSSRVSGHYDMEVDTTELEIGRIYNIAVEIFFDGMPVARKFADGKLIVTEETPEGYLTVTQPATDFYIGNDKDDNFLVAWTVGQIIQGDEIRIIARQEATGSEIILAQGLAVASDNRTIQASNLTFGFSYQIVVRVISEGRVTVSVTAPGTVWVILRSVGPIADRDIGNVNEVTVEWDYSNVPAGSSVKIDFRDRDNFEIIEAASGISPQVGSYSVLTLDLELGHSYNVITRLMVNGQAIASTVAPGIYTVLLKAILDPNAENNLARGEPITIGWQIPAESQIDQASSITILRRDLTMLVEPGNPDANLTTIIEQLSPTTEDNATGNTYVAATDGWALGHSYRMIVRLVSASQQILVEAWTAIQTGVSMRVLSPAADIEVAQSQQVGVAWQLSAIPDPDASTITIVFRDAADPDDPSPHSVSGISPDQDGVMLAIDSLIVDHIYDIIVELRDSQGRLVVSGAAPGKLTVLEAFILGAQPAITLDEPSSPYIARGGSTENVSYTLTNAKGTWLYLFLDPDTNPNNSNELLLYISIAVQPQDNSTGNLVVNANALPNNIQPGQRYNFGGALIDPNALVILAYDYADNAALTVPADYQGVYELGEVLTSGLDGAIFKGFRQNDEAGWSVAGLDYSGDGYGDLVVLARSATPTGAGVKAGELYVIEGRSQRYSGQIELNSIGSAVLPGSLIQGVAENGLTDVAGDPGGAQDRLFTLADYTGDGRPELAMSNPAARALTLNVLTDGMYLLTVTTSGNVTIDDTTPVSFLVHAAKPTLGTGQYEQVTLGGMTITSMTYVWFDDADTPVEHRETIEGIEISWEWPVTNGLYDPNPAPGTVVDIEFSLPALTGLSEKPSDDSVAAMLAGAVTPQGTNQYAGSGYVISSEQLNSTTYGVGSSSMQTLAGYTEPLWFYGVPAASFALSSQMGDQVGSVWNMRGQGKTLTVFSAPGPDNGTLGSGGHLYAVDLSSWPSSNQATGTDYASEALTNGFDIFDDDDGLTNGHGVGDFNRDGLGDLMCANPTVNSNAGKFYIIYGTTSLTINQNAIDVATLNDANMPVGLVLAGGAAGDQLGAGVTPLMPRPAVGGEARGFDFNGDGLPDALFGAPGADVDGMSNAGKVYILFGQSIDDVPAFVGNRNVSDIGNSTSSDPLPGVVFTGPAANAGAGALLRVAGDINGDDHDDFMVILPDRGEVYVIYGYSGPQLTDPDTDLPAVDLDGDGQTDIEYSLNDVLSTIPGVLFKADSGDTLRSAASAYDVDGDGIDDLVFGVPDADPSGRTSAGQVYIIYGRSSQ